MKLHMHVHTGSLTSMDPDFIWFLEKISTIIQIHEEAFVIKKVIENKGVNAITLLSDEEQAMLKNVILRHAVIGKTCFFCRNSFTWKDQLSVQYIWTGCPPEQKPHHMRCTPGKKHFLPPTSASSDA